MPIFPPRKSNKKAGLPWDQDSNFQLIWKKRIELMASYIGPEDQVLDFGCGLMWLESYLTKNNKYIPIDYIKRDDRTIVCDFNLGEFPNIPFGTAFLSGIIEYIKNVNDFINQLKNQKYKRIILSYCTIEMIKNRRQRIKLNWVNHESIFELIAKFFPEYVLIKIDNNIPKNTILVFQRTLP